MSQAENAALISFLKTYIGIEFSDEDLNDTALPAVNITTAIERQAGGLPMDVEPSNFSKILEDLAPDNLKMTGKIND